MVFSEGVLFLAAELSENSRQGFATKNAALFLSFELRNSTTALGIAGTLALEGVRKNDSARYYSNVTGRFLSEDPIRFNSGTVNFYAYADNDPINGDDPFGLRTRVCCRPLRNAVFGRFLGFNHCYLVITSDDDQLQYHTYGLHREDPGNVPYPGGARPVPDDPTDVGGTCAEVPDATPCKERKLVQQSMSDTNCPSCGSNYSVLLTNSNYWVWDALKKAGMTPPTFFEGYWSPGYGELPPEAR